MERGITGYMRKITISIFLCMFIITGTAGLSTAGMKLDLEGSINYALEHSRSVLAAGEKLNEAKAQVATARASFIPSVNITGSYTGIPEAQSLIFPDGAGGYTEMVFRGKDTYMYGTTVSQPLFMSGLLVNAYGLSTANKRASEEEYLKAKDEVVFETKKAFYTLLLAREMKTLSEESYSQTKKHVDQVKVMYDNGMVSKLDLLRAQVQLSNIRPRVTQAENGLALAEDAFRMTLGVPPGTEIEVEGEFRFEPVEVDTEESVSTALKSASDLIIMKEREKMVKKQIGMARAECLPSVIAMYNDQHMKPYNFVNDWGDEWNVMLQLQFPIFNGLGVRGKVNSAKAQLKQAQYGYQTLREATALQVRQTCMTLQQEEETIASQKQNIEQAKEALSIAEERYNRGIISNLEYMDTQLALTQAKANYFQAITNYAVAKARLMWITKQNTDRERGN